tara:strand:- start:347 stop:553 length:207 start_codon:yes stop_codon:yes gene_type:complete
MIKGIGTGFAKGVTLNSIEVLRAGSGSPFLNLLGKAKKKADEYDLETFMLSISDTEKHSLALVVGEGK